MHWCNSNNNNESLKQVPAALECTCTANSHKYAGSQSSVKRIEPVQNKQKPNNFIRLAQYLQNSKKWPEGNFRLIFNCQRENLKKGFQKKIDYFQGKVAIITGSGQGLGKAFAKQLLMRGARVWIHFLIFLLTTHSFYCDAGLVSFSNLFVDHDHSFPLLWCGWFLGVSFWCENRNWIEDFGRIWGGLRFSQCSLYQVCES